MKLAARFGCLFDFFVLFFCIDASARFFYPKYLVFLHIAVWHAAMGRRWAQGQKSPFFPIVALRIVSYPFSLSVSKVESFVFVLAKTTGSLARTASSR